MICLLVECQWVMFQLWQVMMYKYEQGILMKIGNNWLLYGSVLVGVVGVLLLVGCQCESELVFVIDVVFVVEVIVVGEMLVMEVLLDLCDVIENNECEVVGISYLVGIDCYFGLVCVLQDYVISVCSDLQQVLDGFGNDKLIMFYELLLSFEKLLEMLQLVVVSVDGSCYIGGVYGELLVVCFVWLLVQQQMFSVDKLVVDVKGWKVISEFVVDQLCECVVICFSGEDMDLVQLQELLCNVLCMIVDGIGLQVDNFSQFQLVIDDKGQIIVLCFVFLLYQVGLYLDGIQIVDVLVVVLLLYVVKDYVELFVCG